MWLTLFYFLCLSDEATNQDVLQMVLANEKAGEGIDVCRFLKNALWEETVMYLVFNDHPMAVFGAGSIEKILCLGFRESIEKDIYAIGTIDPNSRVATAGTFSLIRHDVEPHGSGSGSFFHLWTNRDGNWVLSVAYERLNRPDVTLEPSAHEATSFVSCPSPEQGFRDIDFEEYRNRVCGRDSAQFVIWGNQISETSESISDDFPYKEFRINRVAREIQQLSASRFFSTGRIEFQSASEGKQIAGLFVTFWAVDSEGECKVQLDLMFLP